MALYHLSVKPVSRRTGRSAVAAAAYRAADRLVNARDGMEHDFTRRSGVEHAEIVLPGDTLAKDGSVVLGNGPAWARERAALWNAAELAEKRKDSRVAQEIEIALPHELSAEERLALTRGFAQSVAERYGVAVDFAIHRPHGQTDVRNHHAHLLMTTRRVMAARDTRGRWIEPVAPGQLGEKCDLELENGRLAALGLPGSRQQIRDIRIGWEQMANLHLARAGLEVRIDHRSHQERGLEIEPTRHVGVHATQMERRGKNVSRIRLDAEAARKNAALIREKPEQVLTLITQEKSVFDRRDIARVLHRYVDDAEAFQAALVKVMASPALLELQAAVFDAGGRELEPARYSTREMGRIEREMAEQADRMAAALGFRVGKRPVEMALAQQERAIIRAGGIGLAAEQRAAIAHITGSERLAVMVGLAGTGKTATLAAARSAWEMRGFRVRGAALSGKAASGMEEASGIESRTLASWSRGWDVGVAPLGPGDVLVIDEAGMVGSRQLARVIAEAERAGAKLVLIGDPEQLQPIGAGAAFRAIAERVGFVELEGVRRQHAAWQREASIAFGRHRTADGLAAYAAHGSVRFLADGSSARAEIVADVMADMALRPQGSRLVLAHRRADAQALNEAIRSARQEQGELADDAAGGELLYRTTEGERAFAPGDRVLFRENNRDLGVKNGMLGTVTGTAAERLEIRLDSAAGPGLGRAVSVPIAEYAAVDHGYAATIHKGQGATVDRAFVLASGLMDRHLTYVAMTRHREVVTLYADREEFADLKTLTARLSRSQAKETTLDYARDGRPEAERGRAFCGFAARRGIDSEIVVARTSAPAMERQAPEAGLGPAAAKPAEKRSSAFEGLRLTAKGSAADPKKTVLDHERAAASSAGRGMERTGPGAPREVEAEKAAVRKPLSEAQRQEGELSLPGGALEPGKEKRMEKPRSMFDGLRLKTGREATTPEKAVAPLELTVERYAQAWAGVERQRADNLPVLEGQQTALRAAEAALEAVKPGAVRDLGVALDYDRGLRPAMLERSGTERAQAVLAGIERGAELRQNPDLRLQLVIKDWAELKEHEEALVQRGVIRPWSLDRAPTPARQRLEAALDRDPEVLALARAQAKAQQERYWFGDESLLGDALSRRDRAARWEQRHEHQKQEHSRSQGRDHGMSR